MDYRNRYGDIYHFEKDQNGDIIWTGTFELCRFGFIDDPEIITMIDPSGGPYVSIDDDMETISKEFKGYIVDGFEKIEGGYKIKIKTT